MVCEISFRFYLYYNFFKDHNTRILTRREKPDFYQDFTFFYQMCCPIPAYLYRDSISLPGDKTGSG